jgi:integrase
MRDISYDNCTIILRDTKNGETRTVPLSSRAIALLKAYTPTSEDELFGITPDAATQAFKRALDRARGRYEAECKESGKTPNPRFLVNLRLHDMRHEATSRFFENTDLREMEIMQITGHKDSRQLKRYTHLRAKDLAKRLG